MKIELTPWTCQNHTSHGVGARLQHCQVRLVFKRGAVAIGLLDTLIPEGDGIPSASTRDLSVNWTQRYKVPCTPHDFRLFGKYGKLRRAYQEAWLRWTFRPTWTGGVPK